MRFGPSHESTVPTTHRDHRIARPQRPFFRDAGTASSTGLMLFNDGGIMEYNSGGNMEFTNV